MKPLAWFMSRDLRRLVWLPALALLALAPAARAQCPYSGLWPPDQPFTWGQPDIIATINPGAPYWIVMGLDAADPVDDYDLTAYANAPGNPCLSGPLASSYNGAGRTDFVVGDFNYNPYGYYYVDLKCFSGHCDYVYGRAAAIWRSGDLLTVDGGAATVDVTTAASDPNKIVKIWDVYLNAGTTYYFRFQTTGDRQSKLLLFRNPSAGVYWAGRNAAEFEVTGCTKYAAPTTGYYGVVVVHDARSSFPSSFTVGVSTFPDCHCYATLAPGVPQLLAAGETGAYDLVVQPDNFWEAVAIRSPSDWDLRAWATPTSGPDVGCFISTLATSSVYPPRADVLAGDYSISWATLPDTVSIRASRFSGGDGATIQLDQGRDQLFSNGWKEAGTLYGDDIVRVWDVYLRQGTTYTFTLGSSGADEKLLLFGNYTSGLLWRGRAQSFFETSSAATFTPTWDGWYGLVLVKDDANVGGYVVGFGECSTPDTLADKQVQLAISGAQRYLTFDQPANRWTAAGVYSAEADFDIRQYDQASGSPWPDCFGSPGALSNGVGFVDFVVGDFHFNSPAYQYLRSYQFTTGTPAASQVQWDAGSGDLLVNASTPVNVSWNVNPPWTDVLRCYQVYLVGGTPYTFEFGRSGLADSRLLLFVNPANGVFWAPRSAAQFSTTGDFNYTAPQSGWYGVVVVNDNGQAGSFSLRVTSSVVAVDAGRPPLRDALRSIGPNPARGALRVGFDLAEAGEPAFELLDMQGRVMARTSPGAFGPGRWEVPVSPADGGGRPLAAGLYLVRMRVGARTVDSRKVAVIN